MTWLEVELWLKTTIPGIIVLGAVGSIVAYYVIKIASAVARRIFRVALERLIVFNFKPFTMSAILVNRFASTNRPTHLVIYALGALIALNAWVVILLLCLVALVVVAVQFGTSAPGLLATLIGGTSLSAIMLLRQLMSAAGVASLLFYKDMQETNRP
jgi:hypothetical protein